jgi:hypothetical protein
MAAKAANQTAPSAEHVVQVAAGVGAASFSYQGRDRVSVQVRLHSAGTLSYVNRHGDTYTLTEMPAGIEPIEAQAILAATNVKVTVYF